MLFTIQELLVHRIEFDQSFAPGEIDLGAELRQRTPLATRGRADLVEEHRGGREGVVRDIRVVGSLSTEIEVNCARCLENVVRGVQRDFDLLYRPLGVDRRADEVAIHEADTEIGYYGGASLALEDVLREQVLLAVPIKLVCRDDCRGLCPHCGRNLNGEACNCSPPADDRWQALQDLKNKLQGD
jgi:uncharacterized protein